MITSLVIAIGETMLALPLAILAWILDMDSIIHIYRFLPSYNLLTLFVWLTGETPGGSEMPSWEMIVDSQLFNEAVLVCWVIGSIALTEYLFQRQDITN